MSADWYEDPSALQPSGVLTHATSPEVIRKAYRRLGACFGMDAEGTLTMELELDLGKVSKSLQEKRTSLGVATG